MAAKKLTPSLLPTSYTRGSAVTLVANDDPFLQVQIPSAYQLPCAYLVSATRRILSSRFRSRTLRCFAALSGPLLIQGPRFIQQHERWRFLMIKSATALIGDFVSHGVFLPIAAKFPEATLEVFLRLALQGKIDFGRG